MFNKFNKLTLLLFVLSISILPLFSLAHQPRITESRLTNVVDPEISKAYYGRLTGEPDVYIIEESKPFNLYVNVLVPDIKDQKKDVSAVVIQNGDFDKPLAVLEGINFEWKRFYEPFGADSYWMGPEYESKVDAGRYEIRVWSSNNDSKYSLAIGKIEAFDGKEGMNALTLIPKLKTTFFEYSPISFIKSPFGWGLILSMYIIAFILGLVLRVILKKVAKNRFASGSKNIGKNDRFVRLLIGVGLLIWAVTSTWSPIVLFFSGFAIFESIFSWCTFYQLMGKNTCSV